MSPQSWVDNELKVKYELEPQTCCYFQTIQDRTGYQCDLEFVIAEIFGDIENKPSYQAIGSEKQIFSVSVNKTYNQNRFR